MRIIKNAKIGNKKGTQLIFGTGDIVIHNGKKPDTGLDVLVMSQHHEKPESEWDNIKTDHFDTDGLNPPIVEMVFHKKKSVEVLINKLNDVLNNWDLTVDEYIEIHHPDKLK